MIKSKGLPRNAQGLGISVVSLEKVLHDGNWAPIGCFAGCLRGFLFYKMKNQTPEVLSLMAPFSPF